MAYGILKVDTITFTDAGVDKSVTISGLVQNPTFSGNITVTGTVSGDTIQGQTVSGATVTGDAGSFTTVTGGVATITSGVFALGTNALPSISFSSDPNTGIYSPGADQVAVATNGTGRLFVASNGNVGIGAAVSSPGRILHVDSASTSNSYIRFTNSNSTGNGAEVGLFDSGAANPSLVLANTMSDGNVIINTNGDERVRITETGKVGIGTSSPDFNCHIIGTGTDLLKIQRSGAGGGAKFRMINGDANYYDIFHDGSEALDIQYNGTSRLKINSAGNVGIGTTSPESLLDLAGNNTGLTSPLNANNRLRFTDTDTTQTNGQPTGTIEWYTSDTGSPGVHAYISTDMFNSGTGALVIGTGSGGSADERVRITETGAVGIGTAPATLLHIAASSDPELRIEATGTAASDDARLVLKTTNGEFLIQNDRSLGTSGVLTFNGSATDNLCIDHATGSVGIGTTNPGAYNDAAENLVIAGGANTGVSIVSGSATGASRIYFARGTSAVGSDDRKGQINYLHTDDALQLVTAAGERVRIDSSGTFRVKGAGTAGVNDAVQLNGSAPANSLLLDASGRLLVGTISASYSTTVKLQGNSASSTSESRIRLCRGTASPANNDTLAILGFSDNTETPSAEIAAQRDGGTWSASSVPGRLVFSTTANGASSPTERMRISNDGGFSAFCDNNSDFIVRTDTSAGETAFKIQGGATNNTNGNQKMRILSNGDVENNNNSYGAISDIKLKENIVDASSQWDDLKTLHVCNYNFKEETGHQTHTQIGLIAQEVELVSPGLVSESPDRDEDGNDLGTVTKSVNYSVLYMKAVKALQEAMERIEQLEQRLTDAGIA